MRNQVATVENVNNIQGGIVIPFKVLGQKNSKLMDMLSQPYKDPAMAVIREYTTNAIDSHVAAGQTRPVEITSPSRLFPFFVVEDFGIGLNLDEIESIYTRYVVSTKEETDDQTGNLGIGSKAGLAFVGQYTVASVKDGQKIVGIVTRDDIGDPIMICEISDTDEQNGVKITIPVNFDSSYEFDDFNKKIRHFHQFLKPGILLVDGHEADRSKFQSIGDNMELNYELEDDYIVMGSVAYPVDRNLYPKLHKLSIITYVDMGDVQFPQSRESLRYTVRTKQVLDRYRDKFTTNMYEYMRTAVQGAENRRIAYNLQYELMWNTSFTGNEPFIYKGKKLPNNFAARREGIGYSKYKWNFRTWSNTYCERVVDDGVLTTIEDNVLYIVNWTNMRFTKTQTNKVDKYLEQNNLPSHGRVAILINKVDPELLTGCTVIDWNDVKAVKLPGTGSRSKKAKHYFGMSEGKYREFEPDASKIIWYARRDEMTTARYPDWERTLRNWNRDGEEFVLVTMSFTEKFLKAYPNAKHWRKYYEEKYVEYLTSLTDQDYDHLAAVGDVPGGRMLIASKILDPDLKLAAEFTQDLTSDEQKATFKKFDAAQELLRKTGWGFEQKIHQTYREPVRAGRRDDLVSKYPLLERIYYTHDKQVHEHLTEYVNMIYKNRGV